AVDGMALDGQRLVVLARGMHANDHDQPGLCRCVARFDGRYRGPWLGRCRWLQQAFEPGRLFDMRCLGTCSAGQTATRYHLSPIRLSSAERRAAMLFVAGARVSRQRPGDHTADAMLVGINRKGCAAISNPARRRNAPRLRRPQPSPAKQDESVPYNPGVLRSSDWTSKANAPPARACRGSWRDTSSNLARASRSLRPGKSCRDLQLRPVLLPARSQARSWR